jgi:hypothetical protein
MYEVYLYFTLKCRRPAQNATMHSSPFQYNRDSIPLSPHPSTPSPSIQRLHLRAEIWSGDLCNTSTHLYLVTIIFNIKDLPSHRQRPPIPPNTSPASLLRPQCPCHICICSPLHSPSRDPRSPSTRLLLSASSRLWLSFRGMAIGEFGDLARSRDNVGSWCVCTRSRGSSGYPWGRGVRLLLGSGLVRLPTDSTLVLLSENQG